jgi:hypothetical protein
LREGINVESQNQAPARVFELFAFLIGKFQRRLKKDLFQTQKNKKLPIYILRARAGFDIWVSLFF